MKFTFSELSQGLVCQEFGSGRDTELLDTKINMMRKIIAKAHGYVKVIGH